MTWLLLSPFTLGFVYFLYLRFKTPSSDDSFFAIHRQLHKKAVLERIILLEDPIYWTMPIGEKPLYTSL
ncbi:MAG: hypothetical protein SH856_03125 [Flavobacteriales bacterium]|nr:hypothetical protein [Flavobacteriales bacterium]